MRVNVLASSLKVGDVVDFYGRGTAIILREQEPDTHPILGGGGYFKFWARCREDGREGWLKFGLKGRIDRIKKA